MNRRLEEYSPFRRRLRVHTLALALLVPTFLLVPLALPGRSDASKGGRRRATKQHRKLVRSYEKRALPKRELHAGFAPFSVVRLAHEKDLQQFTAWGYTRDGKRKELGFLHFLASPWGTLEIRDANVKKPYRRHGVQTLLFAEAVKKSNAETITLKRSFVGTNRDVFASALMSRLRGMMDFIAPDPAKGSAEQVQECCRHLLERLSKKKRRALALRAVQQMPAYRTRARLGFTKVSDLDFYFPERGSVNYPLYLSFVARKK